MKTTKSEKYLFLFSSILLLTIFVSALVSFPAPWDFLSYHLPSALQKFDLTTFHPNYRLTEVIKGFPPAAHYVQGFLVWITGSSRFAVLIGFISLAIILAALWLETRSVPKIIWATALFLCVPLLSLHLMCPYVDLWTGAWVGVAIYFLFMAFQKGLSLRRVFLITMAVLVAGLSKMQSWPILGVALTYFSIVWIVTGFRSQKIEMKTVRNFIFLLVLSGSALLAWPLRNYFIYSNPTYPWSVGAKSTAQNEFSVGVGAASIDDQAPAYLQDQPPVIKYLASVFEIGRIWEPYVSYNFDMWKGGKDFVHQRMGGWGVWTVLLFIFLLISQARAKRSFLPISLGFLTIFFAIGFISQGHELRYWLGLPIGVILCLVDSSEKMFPERRWMFYVAFVLTLIPVVGRIKLRFRTIEDMAPTEAQLFWKSADRDQTYIIQDKLPNEIFWSGPDFNTFKVSADGRSGDGH
jgi:hypothetical protein